MDYGSRVRIASWVEAIPRAPYQGYGEPRRGTKHPTPPAATPSPGRAAGPSSPPPGAPPCTCASLGGAAPAALGRTVRGIGSRDSVRGIGTRDQFEGFEQQPPTRIANSPSAAVTARLVVNPNHVVHPQ